MAEKFSLQGYNIYDLTSPFYTDRCTQAHINGNDIVLKDRLVDVYPSNLSVYPDNCQLNIAEIELKRFNCTCGPNTTENIKDTEKNINNQTSENFVNYLVDKINYQVFLCYKTIKQATVKTFFKNPGAILVFSFTIFNLIGFSIFTFYFIKNIKKQILKLMPKDIIDETPKIKTNNSPPKKVIKKKIIIRKPKNINIPKSNDAIIQEEDNSERKNIENK